MKNMLKKIMTLTALGTLLASTAAFSADANSAKQLKSRLQSAKAKISKILNNQKSLEGFEGFEGTEVKEEDTQALSRLSSANLALEEAAILAEDAEIAFSSLNFQKGNYFFVKSCSQAAIARSRVARANILANQPPVGWLVSFSSDMGDVVFELQDLKADVGCP